MRSLYLGGGTPSRLGPDGVAQLLEVLRTRWHAVDGEVTLEANPEDVTPAAASAWRTAGVNRVSLGAQSFDDHVLTWMHRTHDARAIRAAADALCAAGIDNWSLDLIYGLPPEVPRDWERDLRSAIALTPQHISAYGLTVEPGTPAERWRSRGLASDTDESTFEREFLLAHDLLGAAGFEHYEVSNFARRGARAVHNAAYWERVPYVGVGPSAHEMSGPPHAVRRRWNRRNYVDWLSRLRGGADPMEGEETLSAGSTLVETVFLGLRTTAGLSLQSVDEHEFVGSWVANGWGMLEQGTVRLTPLGWLRMDALSRALTDLRSR